MLPPERGRIFDRDGRVVADNKRVVQVAVDWTVIRDPDARLALFTRLSGPLQMPVEELEARYQPKVYSTLLPLPLADDVPEVAGLGHQHVEQVAVDRHQPVLRALEIALHDRQWGTELVRDVGHHPPALGLGGLDRLGHRVERPAQLSELVVAANGHTSIAPSS